MNDATPFPDVTQEDILIELLRTGMAIDHDDPSVWFNSFLLHTDQIHKGFETRLYFYTWVERTYRSDLGLLPELEKMRAWMVYSRYVTQRK